MPSNWKYASQPNQMYVIFMINSCTICCKRFLTYFQGSAAAKRSPNATYKTVGRPRYYQILVRLATQEFLLPKFMSARVRRCSHVGCVVIKIYIFFFISFYVGQPKVCVDHPAYRLVGIFRSSYDNALRWMTCRTLLMISQHWFR